jgi:hypothetical protein
VFEPSGCGWAARPLDFQEQPYLGVAEPDHRQVALTVATPVRVSPIVTTPSAGGA